MQTIQGVRVSVDDVVYFTILHRYDITPKHGAYRGTIGYQIAKQHTPNLSQYYRGLKHELIASEEGFEHGTYLLFETEIEGLIAVKEDWITPGSFRRYSNDHVDLRVYGVATVEQQKALMDAIKHLGFQTDRLK